MSFGVVLGGDKNLCSLASHGGSQVITIGTTGTFARTAISKAARPKRPGPDGGDLVPARLGLADGVPAGAPAGPEDGDSAHGRDAMPWGAGYRNGTV